MEDKIFHAIFAERIRVLKELLSLGIEFSDKVLKDITGLTEEQILEVKSAKKQVVRSGIIL